MFQKQIFAKAVVEVVESVIKLSPIDDVYVKNSREDMTEMAFSMVFCRNYYTLQMLRFVIFTIILFGLQNSSWAQIILC